MATINYTTLQLPKILWDYSELIQDTPHFEVRRYKHKKGIIFRIPKGAEVGQTFHAFMEHEINLSNTLRTGTLTMKVQITFVPCFMGVFSGFKELKGSYETDWNDEDYGEDYFNEVMDLPNKYKNMKWLKSEIIEAHSKALMIIKQLKKINAAHNDEPRNIFERMELRKKYKNIADTMKLMYRQINESLPYAVQWLPGGITPADSQYLYELLKANIKFKHDPKETELLQSMETMLTGKYWGYSAGDCDCMVITASACCLVIGIPCKIILAGRSWAQPVHIYNIVKDRGRWVPFDLTNDFFGEERKYKCTQIISL